MTSTARRRIGRVIGVFAMLALCATGVRAAGETTIIMEEFMVPGKDPGIQLYVRNKHPQAMKNFGPEKIVLYVHGATYPAETAFDLPLNGLSWMDYIARRGYDVYLVDIRGYGKSTRPAEMDQPADQNPPIVRTDTAVKDVGSVVDFILKRRGVANINLLGWSWGTSIMGWYTAQNNDKVNKLVLYAPGWLRNAPSLTDSGDKLGAYRSVSMASAKARWLTGVPEGKKASLIPAGWFEAWAEATIATDPIRLEIESAHAPARRTVWCKTGVNTGGPANRSTIRQRYVCQHYWSTQSGIRTYRATCSMPTSRSSRTPRTSDTFRLGEGTHTVIMEKNRMQLFEAVQQFLDENLKPDM